MFCVRSPLPRRRYIWKRRTVWRELMFTRKCLRSWLPMLEKRNAIRVSPVRHNRERSFGHNRHGSKNATCNKRPWNRQPSIGGQYGWALRGNAGYIWRKHDRTVGHVAAKLTSGMPSVW